MMEQKRNYINNYIYSIFIRFMESIEAGEMAYALTDSVIGDIVETADADKFNNSDIDMALSRIMMKTFCEK